MHYLMWTMFHIWEIWSDHCSVPMFLDGKIDWEKRKRDEFFLNFFHSDIVDWEIIIRCVSVAQMNMEQQPKRKLCKKSVHRNKSVTNIMIYTRKSISGFSWISIISVVHQLRNKLSKRKMINCLRWFVFLEFHKIFSGNYTNVI